MTGRWAYQFVRKHSETNEIVVLESCINGEEEKRVKRF